jgi:putative selenate reductase FAD-binding subunit
MGFRAIPTRWREDIFMIEHFHRPRTLRDALGLKRKLKDRAAYLAGGTFLNSLDCPAVPEHCISLEGLGLDHIEVLKGDLVLGALCTLQQLVESRRVPEALKAAALQLVSRNVRNAATVGGNVAAGLPHSDLLPMLVALDARVALGGAKGKPVPLTDYLEAPGGALITAVVIPGAAAGRLAACRNFRGSAHTRSTITAAVSMTAASAVVEDPIVALGGLTKHVVRLAAVEKALAGKALPAPDELAALVSARLKPASTPFESGEFRRYQAGVVVALALKEARAQKGGRR